MKKIAMLAVALAAAGACAPAMAVESGAFVRVEAGNSQFDMDTDFGVSGNVDDTSYNVRGGYYFSPNFAFEAFYSRYGEETRQSDLQCIDPPCGLSRVRFGGFGLGVVGKKNLRNDGDGFYLSGRAGVVQMKSEIYFSGSGTIDDNKASPYVGVGIGYDFLPELGVGLNYDYLRTKPELGGVGLDIKTQTLTLSLEYRFIF